MLVFSSETSCDETSVCIMQDDQILKHIIYSQEIHNNFGGVVPELASRSHLAKLQEITQNAFNQTNLKLTDIDVFAATCGPGLIGSLLVGSTFTKSLAIACKKPFVPINHLEGHILSTSYNNNISYPHLVFLLTGGHTQIYLMNSEKEIELLGESIDDAIGEAFDKTAKLLGLDYPGGVEIESMAKYGNEDSYKLPKPLINEKNFNFSFSGIKTHINLLTKKERIDDSFIKNLSASFQKNITEILVSKLSIGLKILEDKNIYINSISVVGGVANNKYILNNIKKYCKKNGIELYFPLIEMMSDNAAMIAWACIKNYNDEKNNIFFSPNPRMKVSNRL